ncbi:MAG: PAS domain S-box-containing protein [Halioglobus sp.]|jgi:PAS domain S-box-containing protein
MRRQKPDKSTGNEEGGGDSLHKQLVDKAFDAFITMNVEGQVVSWNRRAEQIFGWMESEIVGEKLEDYIIPTQFRDRHRVGLERYLTTGEGPVINQVVELTALNKGGSEFPIELSISAAQWDGETTFIGIVRDATEKQQLLMAVEQERQGLFEMLDNLPASFHLQADDYSIPFANKEFRKRFGDPETLPCYSVMHQRDRPCEPCETFRVFDTKENEQSIWTALDGRTYFTVCTPYQDADGTALVMEMAIDISAQRRAEEAMLIAKTEADRANQAKSEFLSRMSHELRTPLNAIIGFSQLMTMNSSGHLDTKELAQIQHILDAGEHLLDLVNDVLDITQIETGQMRFNNEVVDVHEVLEEIVIMVEPLVRRHGINPIGLEKSPHKLLVNIDSLRFKQVILNLVSNAIKYNVEQGDVVIAYREAAQGYVDVIVSDTGTGIASGADQEEIFQSFSRLATDANEIEGSGIGLTIVKKLLEEMGGSVALLSEVGKGSTFTVTIPRAGLDRDTEIIARQLD